MKKSHSLALALLVGTHIVLAQQPKPKQPIVPDTLSPVVVKANAPKVYTKPNEPDLNQFRSTDQLAGSPGSSMMMKIDTRYEGVKGSAYFLPNWEEGVLVMSYGDTLRNAYLKLDVLNKQVRMLRPKGDSIVIDYNQLKGFFLRNPDGGQWMTFKKVQQLKTGLGVLPDSYLLAYSEGNASLYKHYSRRILKADFKDPYSTGRPYDSVVDNSEWFYQRDKGNYERLKLNKKSVINALNDQRDEVKTFIDQNNLNCETPDQVLRVFGYYNTLKKGGQ